MMKDNSLNQNYLTKIVSLYQIKLSLMNTKTKPVLLPFPSLPFPQSNEKSLKTYFKSLKSFFRYCEVIQGLTKWRE